MSRIVNKKEKRKESEIKNKIKRKEIDEIQRICGQQKKEGKEQQVNKMKTKARKDKIRILQEKNNTIKKIMIVDMIYC